MSPDRTERLQENTTGVASQELAARLYQEGDLEGAIEILYQATEDSPDPQLHFMLGNALYRAERWDAAAEEYRRATELRPVHPDTWLSLGHTLLRAGRVAQAIEALEIAVRQSPVDALPRLALAYGQLRAEHEREALAHARRANALDADWQQRLRIDIRWAPEMIRAIAELLQVAPNRTLEEEEEEVLN